MKLKKLFVFLLIINTLFLSMVVFIVSDYNGATKELEDAYRMQHKSFVLADELRQSSDDLTRLARTYVITGDKMYEEQFHTILDIRNGKQARPKNYNRIYWDFLTLKGSQAKLDGEKIPLRELMKQAGFLENELALLYESQRESDDLTNLEAKAMNAIKGIFQDEKGKYTKRGEPNFKLAREIMHSVEYHQAKISIMQPIDEFYKAFEKRTKQKVQEAHEKVRRLEDYASYSIIALIFLVLFTFYTIISRIINPLEVIKNIMLRLSKNDMQVEIPKNYNIDEVGDLIGTAEVFKSNAIKLIHSEQQNKLLLDLAGEGIFGLDKYGRFTFLNPMACSLLGIEEQDELIGKYLYLVIPSLKMKRGSSKNEKLMLNHASELFFQNSQEEVFPIDYVSTPIYDKNGLLDGSVVVFSDNTQRKNSEDELKRAMREAQSANSAKSVFLANMSHELRTPLNAILGFTSLLKKSFNINDEEKENLSIIQRSGKHLLTIINDILELSKIEAGKIEIKNSDFDLYLCLEEMNQMFQARCADKNIDFEINIHKDVPQYIHCDEVRLRQIMINLLENAVKFTLKGEIQLHVTPLDDRLLFKIQDSGVGISKEHLELIFKAFEQIKLDKASNGGTGLGLAITKELVFKMGGEINVASQEGKGSAFSFTIEYSLCTKEMVLREDKPEILSIKNAKEYSILVVDDIKENRQLLIQLLEHYGFHIEEACNGVEALNVVDNKSIDLIFMDILMPKMDGLQAMNQLQITHKELPIVIVSAYAFEEDKQKALNNGARYYLNKPFEQEDLLWCLIQCLPLDLIYKQKEENSLEIQSPAKPPVRFYEAIQKASQSLNATRIEELLSKEKISQNETKIIQTFIQNFDFEALNAYCQKQMQSTTV